MALETTFIDLTADPVDIRATVGQVHIAVQNIATARAYFAWSRTKPDPAAGGHVLPSCAWAVLSATPADRPAVWFWSSASGGGQIAVSRAAALG